MTIPAGSRFGPYEILSPLGAGGMGEVYRARDSRLGREVAVKVLPPEVSSDESRLSRFELEARAASTLNHPNILTIHDIGRQGEIAYMVSELLEGETLRERIARGAVPFRKSIEIAREIAQGLAAAHERGIVHRDLKPENLFVTRDGRVKILDFGLAKLVHPVASGPHSNAPTVADQTAPGMVLGTVGYMSPEQVRGDAADHRSDIFSFGTILFELLTGKRAFRKDTAAETLAAILREDPPELIQSNQMLPSAAERIVRHCLEKNPEERFQSARDLAFHLQSLSGSSESVGVGAPAGARGNGGRGRRMGLLVAGGALVAIAGFVAGHRAARPAEVTYEQITYRNAPMNTARFTTGGQTILYTAGSPPRIFSARRGSPEIQSTDLPSAFLAAVSKSGKLAILLKPRDEFPVTLGTLAEVPIAGGAPREIAENVGSGDWSADERLAVVRKQGGRFRVEFPLGQVMYEGAAAIGFLRLSPDGRRAAFAEHPVIGDDRGTIRLLDLGTKSSKVISPDCDSISGVAWSADGREVYFSAAMTGSTRQLFASDLSGRSRLVVSVPGNLRVEDVGPEGEILLTRFSGQVRLLATTDEKASPRELSWLDGSIAADVSPDDQAVLFYEGSAGYRQQASIYVRKLDGAPATRIGEGLPRAFSPDGRAVLVFSTVPSPHLAILPVGVGEPRALPGGSIRNVGWAAWVPGGSRVVFAASVGSSESYFLFTQDLQGGAPQQLSELEIAAAGHLLSGNGERILARLPERGFVMVATAGGRSEPVPALTAADFPVWWNPDGKSVVVLPESETATRLETVDLATGKRRVWRAISENPSRSVNLQSIHVSRDGRVLVYSAASAMADLFLARGLR